MRIAELLAVALAALPAQGQTLAGNVVEDHSGRPLASVELRVAKEGVRQLVANPETDGAGNFRVEGVPAGEYRVDVSKLNYAPLTLRIRHGADSKPLAIRMVRYGVLSGRVADADGRVPPGVRINVMTRGPGGAMTSFGNYATPDASGRYRRFNLPPGEYAVAASYGASSALTSSGGAGLKSAVGSGVMLYPNNQRPQWFTVAGGEDYANTDFIIMTTGLYSVSGTVEPAGIRYAVSLIPVEQPAIAAASARLDPQTSAFQLDGIPPGTYDLFALGPVNGYGALGVTLGTDAVYGRVRVVVGGLDVQNLKVPVGKGRSASFVLRMASGQSASACPPNASLRLLPLEAAGVGSPPSVEANFAKPQVVNDLAPIRYQVTVGRLGDTCYSSGRLLDLTSGVDDPVALTVTPAAAVRGRVVGPEGNFPIVLVASDPADSAETVLVAYPDTQRRFSFTGLRPGRYRIGVFPAAEASKARWVADMARMTELDLDGGVTEIELPAPALEPR